MDRDNVQKLLDEFLNWCDLIKGQSPVTVRGKYHKLINLVRWLGDENKTLSLKTLKEYQSYLTHKRLARPGAEKVRVLSGIRTDFKSNILPFVSWLFEKGHIDSDWKKEIDLPPAHRKDPPILSDKQIDEIIELGTKPGPGDSIFSKSRKEEYRDALTFIARTGVRIGAIFNLKKEGVSVSTRQFKVLTKGHVKYLRFTEDLVPMMEKRCKGVGKVWDLKAVNQQYFNDYLHKGCKKAGLPEEISKQITVHTLRHCRASNMLAQGIQMYTIQKALGHESIKTTIDTYGHLDTFAAKVALDMNPQTQKALTLNQRKENIRALMEMCGLTRLDGTSVKFIDSKKGITVKFEWVKTDKCLI